MEKIQNENKNGRESSTIFSFFIVAHIIFHCCRLRIFHYLTFDLMPLSKVFHLSAQGRQAQSNQYLARSAFCRSRKLVLE